jgi:uncharacterized protein YkwD
MRRWALVALALLAPAPAAVAKPASREDALRQWVSVVDATNVPTGWTGSTASCERGAESADSIAATATALNALRDFAGLGPVSFDPAKNDKALAAALMMEAAQNLSHTPGEDWPCSTAEGREAAGRSNLSLGVTGAGAMVGYVDDAGVDSLGHRRWVLDPAATTFGTGSSASANALWTVGDNAPAPTGDPPLIAWPPDGFVPWSLVFGTWSAAINVPGAEAAAPQVSVAVDGEPRAVSDVRTLEPGFGSADPTIAWTTAISPGDRSADHDVAVAIDGVTVNGTAVPVRYTVRAFAAPPPRITTVGYRLPRKLRSGRRITATATVTDAVSIEYQWLRSGRAVPGATRRRYRLGKIDRGKRLRCRITARGVGTVTRLTPKLKVPRR